MNANDIELALRSRAAFNESVERLDADTRLRLRDLRLHAQQAGPQRATARWMWPAGAALTAALALAVFLPTLPHAPAPALPIASPGLTTAQSMPVSAQQNVPTSVAEANASGPDPSAAETPAVESADPDMLSDLDFYGWLAKQPETGKSGG